MRADVNEQEFSKWLLLLGNGSLNSVLQDVPLHTADVPTSFCYQTSLVPEISSNCKPEEMETQVILSPKNSDCLAINEKVLNIIPEALKTYLSTDPVSCNNEEKVQNYPFEFINSLTPSGMPPHRLNLKVGAIVMLLNNLSISQGLCNGTRMKVKRLHEHCVEVSLVTGFNRCSVLIPRIKLSPSDANIPFTQNRLQFPLRHAYSMTINKAQGQTFEKVGLYLPKPVFFHGHLYVAFSRARAMNNIKVRVITLNRDNRQGQKRGVTYTQNIV
eukprot:XP_014768950.1 PREDICTED: ATP-dependent DNA helicase PIF1-like [Octopus bimaculoides]